MRRRRGTSWSLGPRVEAGDVHPPRRRREGGRGRGGRQRPEALRRKDAVGRAAHGREPPGEAGPASGAGGQPVRLTFSLGGTACASGVAAARPPQVAGCSSLRCSTHSRRQRATLRCGTPKAVVDDVAQDAAGPLTVTLARRRSGARARGVDGDRCRPPCAHRSPGSPPGRPVSAAPRDRANLEAQPDRGNRERAGSGAELRELWLHRVAE